MLLEQTPVADAHSLPVDGGGGAQPNTIERKELDAAYLELRKSYRGLMLS